MKREELWNWIFSIQHLFPEFELTDENKALIRRIQNDQTHTDLSFSEVLSLLNIICGRNLFGANADGFDNDERESHFRQRIHELEDDLTLTRKELEQSQREILRIRGDSNMENQYSIASLNDKRLFSSRNSKSQTNDGLERLKLLVISLLKATQLLSKDRRDLYEQLFIVLQGGRVSERDILKRLGLEGELTKVYNDVLKVGSIPFNYSRALRSTNGGLSQRITENDEALRRGGIYFGPFGFIIYTALIFLLGVIFSFLIHEFISANSYLLFQSSSFGLPPLY